MGKRPNLRLLPFLSIAALPFVGAGCATFVKFHAEGTGAANTFVRVDSTPQGVQGTVDTGRTFTTPVNLVLRSDREHTLTFTKEGSEPVVVRLQPQTNGWLWGNILTAGLGCIFDYEKGSNGTLSPDYVIVSFEDESPSPDADEEAEPGEGEGDGTSA